MPARILIVEDNEANLQLVAYLLEMAAHEALSATDGAAAVVLARQHRPDLILCDLQLPVLDGYEVLKRVRLEPDLQQTPVVAVTALSMPSDRTSVLAAGFNGYLSKPIEPENFVAQVDAYLPASLRSRRAPGRVEAALPRRRRDQA
jgi:two-component system cell cycle response regulator DivK